MNRLSLSFLVTVLLATAMSSCGPGASPTALPPPPTATPPPAPTLPSLELPGFLGRLHWLGHASFRFDGPPTIYCDPAVSSFKDEPPPADIILISHGHSDHYFPPTLRLISRPETVIVASKVVGTLVPLDEVSGEVRVLRPGERTTVGAVEIEAVPAYNIGKPYHPKEAESLGFVVTLYGQRLYFAGDTDVIPEMANVRADVALLPIGGTYTMDAREAAQATATIKPAVVLPMHMLADTDVEQFRRLCSCEVVVKEDEH